MGNQMNEILLHGTIFVIICMKNRMRLSSVDIVSRYNLIVSCSTPPSQMVCLLSVGFARSKPAAWQPAAHLTAQWPSDPSDISFWSRVYFKMHMPKCESASGTCDDLPGVAEMMVSFHAHFYKVFQSFSMFFLCFILVKGK